MRLIWPASGLALLGLALWSARNGSGWGALVAGLSACAFAEAARLERGQHELPGRSWYFSRRNAVWAAVPFALAGAWTPYLAGLALYAAASFFFIQHFRHGIAHD